MRIIAKKLTEKTFEKSGNAIFTVTGCSLELVSVSKTENVRGQTFHDVGVRASVVHPGTVVNRETEKWAEAFVEGVQYMVETSNQKMVERLPAEA